MAAVFGQPVYNKQILVQHSFKTADFVKVVNCCVIFYSKQMLSTWTTVMSSQTADVFGQVVIKRILAYMYYWLGYSL